MRRVEESRPIRDGVVRIGHTPQGSGLDSRHVHAALVCAASLLYVLPALYLAAIRPLWHDELFTFYLSHLPTVPALWSALNAGTDLVPLLFHLVTRACVELFGDGPIALRLPAIAGGWLTGLAVFSFVRRRAPFGSALVAMLFPLATMLWPYLFEARPSALVCGLTTTALFCWQSVADEERKSRMPWMILLALSIACAVAIHYYAIFAAAALAAGEAVRSRRRQRIDVPVCLALATAGAPIALSYAHVSAGLTYVHGFWSRSGFTTGLDFYRDALGPAAAALVTLLAAPLAAPRTQAPGGRRSPYPPHEVAALVSLAIMPIVVSALARALLMGFADRYLLFTVPAVAVFAGRAAESPGGKRLVVVGSVAAVIVGLVGHGTRDSAAAARRRRAEIADASAFIERRTAPGERVVVAKPSEYLEVQFYARPDVANRLVYVTDPTLSMRVLGQDTADRALASLSRWVPLRVVERGSIAADSNLTVYTREGDGWWILRSVAAGQFELRAKSGPHELWSIAAAALRSEAREGAFQKN